MDGPVRTETPQFRSVSSGRMSNPDRATCAEEMVQIRQNLRRDLSVLEATKETVEAYLRTFKSAEREVRGMGLRTASLSAEQSAQELTAISQLQAETNCAFRQMEQHLEEICRWLESTKALIIRIEAQVPTA